MRHVAHGYLAVFRGIADVLRVGAGDVREFELERVDDVARFVKAESGLRQIGDAIWIGDLKRLNFGDIRNDLGDFRCFAESAFDFVVVAMADEHQRIALLGKLDGLDVNLGDQRAGGVDDLEVRGLCCDSRTAGETPWAL